MPLLYTSLFQTGAPAPTPVPPRIFAEDFEAPAFFLGGHALRHSMSSSGRRAVSWDAAPEAADAEVLARVQMGSAAERFGVILRGGGAAGTETGWVSQVRTSSEEDVSRYDSGTATTIAQRGEGQRATRRYWIRFRAEGATLRSRVWHDGDPEPAAWGHEITDAGVAGPGWAGLFAFDAGSTTKACDWFSVGRNGAAAPAPGEPVGADQHATDFTGASVADWTQRWSAAGVTFGTLASSTLLAPLMVQNRWVAAGALIVTGGVLRQLNGGDARQLWQFLPPGLARDVDVVARVRDTSSVNNRAAIRVRAGGIAGDERAYYVEMFNGEGIRIRRYLGPDAPVLGSAAFPWTANAFHLLRLSAIGPRLKAKAWRAEDPEPVGWMIEVEDDAIPGPGWIGIGKFSSSGSQQLDCDSIVATVFD